MLLSTHQSTLVRILRLWISPANNPTRASTTSSISTITTNTLSSTSPLYRLDIMIVHVIDRLDQTSSQPTLQTTLLHALAELYGESEYFVRLNAAYITTH